MKGTRIEGTIASENDIRIDGTIEGILNCKAKVIIGPTGVIKGDVRCENAVIEGRLEGNLNVTQLLTVKESAEVHGDVVTNKLLVQSGAVFNVTCTMGENRKSQNSASPMGKKVSNGTPKAKSVGQKATAHQVG
ncbi:MAG: polymer-forming cytoskeletal protein [Bacteroidota bacterium]